MKTISQLITGDLDFLYNEVLQMSEKLECSGYEARTNGVIFGKYDTLLRFFLENRDAIINGSCEEQYIAEAYGEGGNYSYECDYITITSEKTKKGLLITLSLNKYYYSYTSQNQESYWEDPVLKTYLIDLTFD